MLQNSNVLIEPTKLDTSPPHINGKRLFIKVLMLQSSSVFIEPKKKRAPAPSEPRDYTSMKFSVY